MTTADGSPLSARNPRRQAPTARGTFRRPPITCSTTPPLEGTDKSSGSAGMRTENIKKSERNRPAAWRNRPGYPAYPNGCGRLRVRLSEARRGNGDRWKQGSPETLIVGETSRDSVRGR
ncbi:Hypothetical protein NTJ_03160 [Nesidiocoris tenuis]|uniref:Uncharacterized protein n=1 Tax=Nesidiocoris tenuis TaxID=355587 RepID=A0ABN7ADJ8_9HEMI|nr:Hypothetical protein NTJ_03160 [Nesidiocoris tenuis]